MKAVTRSVLLALILYAAPVLAQEGPPAEFGGQGPRGHERMGGELGNLSPEQKEALKKFREERGQQREQFEKIMNARRDLADILRSESSNEAEVMRRVELLNKQFAEMNITRAKRMLKLKEILGNEKFAKSATPAVISCSR